MEKNADESRLSTTETTISSGSLPLSGWRRARVDFAALRRVEGLNRNELNRVAIAVAGIDDAGMPNVRDFHRDQRSRLQRRPHLFAVASSDPHRDQRSWLQKRPLSALVSSVSVFLALTLSPDSQRASQPKILEE